MRRFSILLPIIFTLALHLKCQTTPNKVNMNKNVGLNIEKDIIKAKLYTTLSPYFTISNSDLSKGQSVSMIIDLGYDRVLVPDKSRGGTYGIDCTGEQNCASRGAQYDCPAYNQVVPQCFDASTFFRFNQFSLKDKNVVPLQFQLVQSTAGWSDSLGRSGVLGLSPKSPIWPFINSAYNKPNNQDYIDFSVHYKVKDQNNIYDFSKLDITDSELVANGRYTTTETTFVDADLTKYPTQWVFPKINAKFAESDSRKDIPACIDNQIHEFFLVPDADYDKLTQAIFTKLCKNAQGCKRSASNSADVDNIVISFSSDSSKDITLKPKEFIVFDSNDNANLGFGKLSASTACSGVTGGIVLGRLFFIRSELTIRAYTESKFQLGITYINLPAPSFYYVLLVVLISLVLAIVVAIFLVRACKNKAGHGVNEHLKDEASADE